VEERWQRSESKVDELENLMKQNNAHLNQLINMATSLKLKSAT